MITFDRVTKSYPTKFGFDFVFKDLSFDLPSDRNVALLGDNGAGKSTLIRLMSGSEYCDSGSIYSSKQISWPLGLKTGVHPKMTGRENTRFIGRVHGVSDLDAFEGMVSDFSRLGQKFDLPVKNYSSGMRARLAFGCCIMLPFDVYLIDEVTSVGDAKFRNRAKKAIKQRLKDGASLVMVSHDLDELRQFCDCALFLKDGDAVFFDTLEEGIERYMTLDDA